MFKVNNENIKTASPGLFLNKVTGLRPATLYEKRESGDVFLVYLLLTLNIFHILF